MVIESRSFAPMRRIRSLPSELSLWGGADGSSGGWAGGSLRIGRARGHRRVWRLGQRQGGGSRRTVGPVVLTMAEPFFGEHHRQLAAWAAEVARRSDGTLWIEFAPGWRLGDPSTRLERSRTQGRQGRHGVGRRPSLRQDGSERLPGARRAEAASTATNCRARVRAGHPLVRCSAASRRIDLVGIGVLPGPMRKVLGVTKPFLTPADFAGRNGRDPRVGESRGSPSRRWARP